MASALHIYANLLWRDSKLEEARIKKTAAVRLLQEPHYRLHLDELSKSLLSGHGIELLSSRLADIMSADSCFVYSDDTGNVLVDAASLMAAGKDCLKAEIDRVWDTSSPLSWARNQLAWYIVSRQHIDMRPADLFLAPVDDAESFLAAAWTSRMDLRDHPDHPYNSLRQLLGGETRLELTPDQTAIRLHFNRLLQLQQPQQQPESQQVPPAPQQLPQHQQQQKQQQAGAAAGQERGNCEWGQGGSDGGEGPDVTAATAALQRTSLSQRYPIDKGPRGSHTGTNGHGQGGSGQSGSGRDGEVPGGADDYLDEGEDYDDGGGEYEDEDGEAPYPAARTSSGAAAAGAGGGASGRGADVASAGNAPPRIPPWPLRLDLLHQYVRAVFGSSASPHDHLMGVVALGLVDAGRTMGHRGGGGGGWHAAQAGAAGPEAQRFSLPLPRLVAHVRSTAPQLLTAAGVNGSAGGGGGWHAGALMQRLQERPSRGCFRVLMSGGPDEEAEEAVVVLDLEVLRERVVEALTTAITVVFPGNRPVDLIRRTAAVQLASRTRAFAGRVHCVRLTTLARQLADHLPSDVFDPNRLGGFERLVGAEISSNVMHVFRKLLPGGVAGLAPHGGHGEEVMGTFVTLNLGKLLAAAGVRDLEAVASAARGGGRGDVRGGGEGGGGGGGTGVVWIGRGAPEAAPSGTAVAVAAAAASRAATFTASSSTRDPHAVHTPPPPHHSAAAGGSSSGSSLPPPPSDAALRQAVEALFHMPDSGRGGSGGEHSAVAAKRSAALSLVKALHTQQGGFLPLSRLTDLVLGYVPGAPDLEHLLAADPDVFEIQETWYGGPRSVRLRTSAVMARAARAATTNSSHHSHDSHSHHHHPGSSAATASSSYSDALPRRSNASNCPYYMRTGSCGYGGACKYHHPPLASSSRQSGHGSAEPPVPAAAAAAAAAPGPQRGPAAAVATYRQPPSPQAQTHSQQKLRPELAALSPSTSITTHSEGAAGGSAAAAAAAARLSPTTLEIKVVTTACTPDHLDMLQHCYAAPQVAVACKVRHAHPHAYQGSSSHYPAGELGTVCLVQLYAPAVAAAGGGGAAAGGAGSLGATTHGSASSGAGSTSAAAGGGGGGAAAAAPRWPATVYLVDLAAGEDKKGLLLPSLSPLLEDPAVPKVIYCGSEVVPYMPRLSPLHDISVLHTLFARVPQAVFGAAVVADAPPASAPSLGAMLQQHGVMTAAGAAAMAAAPTHSPLWSSRPLAPELQQQAVLEVVHLASLWTGLMARLGVLPQQLSQAAADRLLAAHSAAQGPAAAAGSGAGPPLMRPTGRVAATAAAPGGMAVVVSTAGPRASGGVGGSSHRGLVSVHRSGW